MNDLFLGIGRVSIRGNEIIIFDYPFEPSCAYKSKVIEASIIKGAYMNTFPPSIRVQNELIFITRELKYELEDFCLRNCIQSLKETNNWKTMLGHQYHEQQLFTLNYQKKTDMESEEVFSYDNAKSIIENIKVELCKYFINTTIWDLIDFGLLEVLLVMKNSYNKEKFAAFYSWAMEIEFGKD